MTKKIWSSVSETAENLGMSASILWRLKRDKHGFIYQGKEPPMLVGLFLK